MLNWKNRKKEEPEEPFMGMGSSNHLLLYSKKEKVWFEGIYDFEKQKYYTISHTDIDNLVSHFCEEIPLPE